MGAALRRGVDISREPEALVERGIDQSAAMQRLHAVDETGRVVSGMTEFVAVWRQLSGCRHLAWLAERFGLVAVLDRAYVRFAAWRYRRRCADGACALRP
jgi:predicted DCC family thiol-disulfide oxidoreductase YuxK